MNRPESERRRAAIAHVLGLAGGCAFCLAAIRHASAGKSSKASFMYQDHPHDGRRCGDCKYFTAGGDARSAGTCALIEGPIEPNGWCMAFAPRE